MSSFLALFSGLVFGLGLLASGMTDPAKVQNFLDLFGSWDPSLALVMGAAIAVALPAFAWAQKRDAAGQRSLAGERFEWPRAASIDPRLLAGGVLFGLGWGLAGFCPGPALVAMASGLQQAWIFGAAMFVGMLVYERFLAPR
jgi:uncharacterized protein